MNSRASFGLRTLVLKPWCISSTLAVKLPSSVEFVVKLAPGEFCSPHVGTVIFAKLSTRMKVAYCVSRCSEPAAAVQMCNQSPRQRLEEYTAQ
jgi:hypothetical protein